MVLTEREPAIKMGEGAWMRFFHDEAKPDSPRYVEVSMDGKPGSFVFNVPSHFHLDHAEYTEVLEGAAEFTLDGKAVLRYAGDGKGPVMIPKRAVHSIRTWEGVPTRLRETAVPIGDFKEVFFRDVFRGQSMADHGGFWLLLRASYDYDGFIPFTGPLKLRWLDVLICRGLGLVARLIAPSRPDFPKLDLRTPVELSWVPARSRPHIE